MTHISELDIIFISYDEPNADDNWYDLLSKCPWAKRSHGIYGSDAAHKAAAKLASTDRFITIDADNIVYPEFFDISLDLSEVGPNSVISWAARNEINGLVYGNGGIKSWPKKLVNSMQTHEAAPKGDKQAQVDFCWGIDYIQMDEVFSTIANDTTPYQAYRAGFREGCKMSLNNGDLSDMKKIYIKNKHRLLIWSSVGSDTVNGLWAIYGARLGCVMTVLRQDEWNWTDVRDFKWHDSFWQNNILPKFETEDGCFCEVTGLQWDAFMLRDEINQLGVIMHDELGLNVDLMTAQASHFFKEVYINYPRTEMTLPENKKISSLVQ